MGYDKIKNGTTNISKWCDLEHSQLITCRYISFLKDTFIYVSDTCRYFSNISSAIFTIERIQYINIFYSLYILTLN